MARQTWEQKVVYEKNSGMRQAARLEHLNGKLAQLGADGWEVVEVKFLGRDTSDCLITVKRPNRSEEE